MSSENESDEFRESTEMHKYRSSSESSSDGDFEAEPKRKRGKHQLAKVMVSSPKKRISKKQRGKGGKSKITLLTRRHNPSANVDDLFKSISCSEYFEVVESLPKPSMETQINEAFNSRILQSRIDKSVATTLPLAKQSGVKALNHEIKATSSKASTIYFNNYHDTFSLFIYPKIVK